MSDGEEMGEGKGGRGVSSHPRLSAGLSVGRSVSPLTCLSVSSRGKTPDVY